MENDWKIKKCGEYEIYYIDFQNKKNDGKNNSENEGREERTSDINGKSGKRIKIVSSDDRKRKRIIGIILAKNNEVIGASEVHIMEDNNAEISTLNFWKEQIELPENLAGEGEEFKRGEGIFIVDRHQGKGYGTDLLKIILTYLETINIKTLEIHGIVQSNGAIKFYEKTGAHIIDQVTAEYDVTKTLKHLKENLTNKRELEL